MRMKLLLTTIISLLFLGIDAFSLSSTLPKGFVYLDSIDPTIDQHLGFATDENCVGKKLDGYNANKVICTLELAKELKKVQRTLKKINPNYSLRVLDAYRPVMATEHLKRWAADLNDQKTKSKYYPNIDKKDLLGKYIAAKKSSHNRGSTADIVIIDLKTGKELDFGFVSFGGSAHINYSGLTPVQKKNRKFLRKLMLQHNFKPYNAEFWHFTLKNEPFPNKYFNFVIE